MWARRRSSIRKAESVPSCVRFQAGTLVDRNGVWTGMWREYVTLPDGSQRSIKKAKAFPTMSERAARAALQPILDAINKSNTSPMLVEKADPTLRDAVAEWRRLVAPNQKPRGRETAESHLRAHIIPKLGSLAIASLDAKALQDFVAEITPRRSGKTVENVLLTLSGILGHARKGILGKSFKTAPEVRLSDLSLPTKVKSKASRMLSADEIKLLIANAKEPLKTILYVLAFSGLRVNEALALRRVDLDFDKKVIHVEHSAYNGMLGTPKSEASKADVPMPDALAKKLQAFIEDKNYRKNPTGLLFCNRRNRPYSDNKLREKHLTPLLVSLKMNRPGIKFHAIRHAVASEMIDAGAPITVVRDQMRHSDVRVTLGIYGHTIGTAQKDAMNKLADRFVA